jgi:hypothetical protein
MWNQSYLQCRLEIVAPERILFSTDYPYQCRLGGAGRSFLDDAALSLEEKESFAMAIGSAFRSRSLDSLSASSGELPAAFDRRP